MEECGIAEIAVSFCHPLVTFSSRTQWAPDNKTGRINVDSIFPTETSLEKERQQKTHEKKNTNSIFHRTPKVKSISIKLLCCCSRARTTTCYTIFHPQQCTQRLDERAYVWRRYKFLDSREWTPIFWSQHNQPTERVMDFYVIERDKNNVVQCLSLRAHEFFEFFFPLAPAFCWLLLLVCCSRSRSTTSDMSMMKLLLALHQWDLPRISTIARAKSLTQHRRFDFVYSRAESFVHLKYIMQSSWASQLFTIRFFFLLIEETKKCVCSLSTRSQLQSGARPFKINETSFT